LGFQRLPRLLSFGISEDSLSVVIPIHLYQVSEENFKYLFFNLFQYIL
jgi:hypothetical protein